jgi:hypothetical protein
MSSADTTGTVASLLDGLRRRQRALNSLRWAVHGLLFGGGAGCVAAVVMWSVGQSDLTRLLMAAGLTTAFLAWRACLSLLAISPWPVPWTAPARARTASPAPFSSWATTTRNGRGLSSRTRSRT